MFPSGDVSVRIRLNPHLFCFVKEGCGRLCNILSSNPALFSNHEPRFPGRIFRGGLQGGCHDGFAAGLLREAITFFDYVPPGDF